MSNFRLINPQCVLIHIPKTGGTSIRKGIWGSNYEGPVFGYIPDDWKSLYKFAFVRHPFQRFISAWKMFTEGAKGDPSWSLPNDHRPLTLAEFVDIVIDNDIIYDERRSSLEEKIRHHTIPQTHPFNCLSEADYVARYENYDHEVHQICHQLGLPLKQVPRMHFTTPIHWSEVLTGKTLKVLTSFYQEDLDKLGY